MEMLLQLLLLICGLGSLVCFIIVLMQFFQNDQSGLGIACIVLFFCGGIGVLIAFVFGWINHGTWGIKNVMLAWTGCIVAAIILNIMLIPFLGDLP